MASTSRRVACALILIAAIGCERKSVVTQTDSAATTTVMPAQHDTIVTALPDTSRGRPLPVPKPAPGMQSNIRVEQPRAGARVTGPSFVVSGMSRTFENSISYELLSGEGNVISQGHGMSNGSMGQFGPYHLTVNTQGYKGIATLEVFDLSPKDGSKIDVVLVPITIVSDTIGISPNDRISTMPIKG